MGRKEMTQVKLVTLISAIEGISRDDFKRYYEGNHVPLVKSLLPMDKVVRYTRSYVMPERNHPPGTNADFDVVTELWFASEEDCTAFFDVMRRPDVKRRIRDDEKNFLATSKIRTFYVEEHL
jgi:uncharacterized protein (TIGR02118 family)